MKNIFLLLLFAVSFPSFATTSKLSVADTLLGVVTFGPEYNEKDTIKLYNADGSLWHWFTMMESKSDSRMQFRPFSVSPDYYILAMGVVSIKGNRYEIIANEETGLRKFVIVDKRALAFVSAQQFILNSAIGFNASTNPARKAINGEPLKINGDYFTHALSFKGDWLKVKLVDMNNRKELAVAWIRWREGNKILLQIYKD